MPEWRVNFPNAVLRVRGRGLVVEWEDIKAIYLQSGKICLIYTATFDASLFHQLISADLNILAIIGE